MQCKATTKAGTRCRNQAVVASQFCNVHAKSATGSAADIRPADHSRSEKLGAFKTVLSNPWFGGTAAICGIISIPLSIYLFFSGVVQRKLTYYTYPSRTAVFRHGEASGLSVKHKGEVVDENITAAHIALWNAGNEAIRAQHVLQPIKVRLEPRCRILDVKIRDQSREVVGLSVDEAGFDAGIVGLQWNIMEGRDGAVLQITYCGESDTAFRVEGVLENQSTVEPFEYSTTGSGSTTPLIRARHSAVMYGIVVLMYLWIPFFT